MTDRESGGKAEGVDVQAHRREDVKSSPAVHAAPMKILVLDDHHAFRDEVVGMLTRNGHEAHGVATAEAAVPLVESGDFDVVLVDYSMPTHDGAWFLKHVKLPRRSKAILVTAHVNREMMAQMFKLGIAGYLIKPFDEDDLLRHINFYAPRRPPDRTPGGKKS